MTLLSEVKYKTKIEEFEDISPESVLFMLREVITDIGNLDSSFTRNNLAQVLKVVESGQHQINGGVSLSIDLTSAKGIIETYRRYSEGGCQSCLSRGKDVLNQDLDTFWYCGVKEDHIETPKKCGYGCGRSPEVSKHYENPCELWKPRFSPNIERLIEDANR